MSPISARGARTAYALFIVLTLALGCAPDAAVPTLATSSRVPIVGVGEQGSRLTARLDVAAAGATPSAQAASFWTRFGGEFGLSSTELDENPRVVVRGRDSVVRHDLTHEGYPIFGAQARATVRDGRVLFASVEAPGTLRGLNTPTLSSDEAITAAERLAGVALTNPQTELKIFVPKFHGSTSEPRLAYFVRAERGNATFVIDSTTGRPLHRMSLAHDQIERTIHSLANMPAESVPTDDFGALLQAQLIYDESGLVAATDDAEARAAWLHAETVRGYFSQTFERESLGSEETTMLKVVTHSPHHVGNAVFVAPFEGIFFGEGMVSLDVMAHEMAHGLTYNDSGLVYELESGAINEHLSDVMAANIDASDRWQISTATRVLRNLRDPRQTIGPIHMDEYAVRSAAPCDENGMCPHEQICAGDCVEDYGGVHRNSSILNQMYFLLVEGGTHPRGTHVPGMGLEKGQLLIYDVAASELGSTSQFMHYREAAVAVARMRHEDGEMTRAETCSVELAFAAVGIGEAAEDCACYAIADCSVCEASSGCGFTGAGCVPRDEEGAEFVSECPAPSQCSLPTTCQDCVAISSCGFTTNDDCVERTQDGVRFVDSCPVASPCAVATTCDQCNDINGCGFCNGECIDDNEVCLGSRLGTIASCHDCSVHTTCSDCAMDSYCGYCPSTSQCQNVNAPRCGETLSVECP